MQGNPDFSPRLKLYCERGYHLAIRADAVVEGVEDDNDPDCNLELTHAGEVGCVRIQGLNSQRYLCFDSDGTLYGEEDPNNCGTIFEEHFQASYSGYRSKINGGWYVGIKKSGKAKNGNDTEFGQKAVKFLPRR